MSLIDCSRVHEGHPSGTFVTFCVSLHDLGEVLLVERLNHLLLRRCVRVFVRRRVFVTMLNRAEISCTSTDRLTSLLHGR